jgi:hypothetical protein
MFMSALLFRYLSKTFSLAYSYVQPDVVVFLGDLFDEGSKAFPYEYKSYMSRFQSIFYPSHASKVRWPLIAKNWIVKYTY